MGEQVKLDGLTKIYPGGNRALSEVSIEIAPGTFLVLLGPSGSGKTTLLRAVAGIERISAGEIVIGGQLVASPTVHLPPERRDLSMVFQDYALWPHLVARDNVAFALRRRSITGPTARHMATEMLERVGLGALGDRYPNELSGGEQQRVALARALVADTGLVLCDEPLSNLDADLREKMRLEISGLVRAAGATAIYITHDQAEAFALADIVGVLEHGALIQIGAPEEIFENPVSPFVARFTGLAGEMHVQVAGHAADASAIVTAVGSPNARAICARDHRNSQISPDGLLMLRASALTLCAPGDESCQLVGVVTDVAFRGRGYEHAVLIENGVQLAGIFSRTRGTRGERVGLVVDPQGAQLFDAPNVEGLHRSLEISTRDDHDDPGVDVSREFTMFEHASEVN